MGENVIRFPERRRKTNWEDLPPAVSVIFTGNGAVVIGGVRREDGGVRTFCGFVPCEFPVKVKREGDQG